MLHIENLMQKTKNCKCIVCNSYNSARRNVQQHELQHEYLKLCILKNCQKIYILIVIIYKLFIKIIL